MRNLISSLLYLLLCLQASIGRADTAEPNIVVSIKPFYNMVAAISKDPSKLKLLVQGNGSPHDYTLKPSDLQMLKQADIIFWGGKDIEPFLNRVIKKSRYNKIVVNLSALNKIEKFPIRNTKNWQAHDEQNSHSCCGHDFDPHLWLSIDNAKIMAENIAQVLSKHNPSKAKIYQANAKVFLQKLTAMDAELKIKLARIKHKNYLVFHDAYQYFENHYALSPLGAITLHPEIPPSIAHIHNIQTLIKNSNIHCMFREPQFQPQFIDNLIKNTKIRVGVLDPVGKDADLGANGYFILINTIANNMLQCLN